MKHNPLIGRKLANFQIKSLIARGGMADVYLGIDTKLHRQVAIKVFEVEDRSRMAQANRFIQEARVMANWRHNNIIPIFYAGDETGLFYYVMEFIDGYDLAAILAVYAEKGELMPTSDILRIGDSIASALDFAHSQGIIHRDVKPANVLIANDGHVLLGDFGLALDLKAVTQGDVFGSPHYISPEQARRSSDAVSQSDLYSLGVILYEMLTGATPFNDPSPASLALQHITDAPPRPRSINPNLSAKVEEVLLKALDKNPKKRYQSAKSLMDALRNALTDKPEAAPVGAPPLPPIPVNVPTIQRSNISLNSFTKRGDVISALEKHSTTMRRGVIEDLVAAEERSKRKRSAWGILLLLFLLAVLALGWFRPDLLASVSSLLPAALPSQTAIPTQTEQLPVLLPSTDTPSPEPTFTETAIVPTMTITSTATTATFTASPSPTATQTNAPTETLSLTATATSTIIPITSSATSTAQIYPDGYLMTAFYNENSFYLLDKDKASRSLSGFAFERINNDGTFQNRFEGWMWETFYIKVIQPNRCVSLEIDKSPLPYLRPVECENRTLSELGPAMDADELFWTPDGNSSEFRVLWLNQEIARCEIAAGTCDFRVP